MGDLQYLFGPSDKFCREVDAAFGDYSGLAGKDIFAVTADDIRCFPWSGEPSQLLGTYGNPVVSLYHGETVGICFGLSVITGAETDKACTDQKGGMLVSHRQREE